ncbi:MAG: tetratricopeptide repeat protein [Methanobacteriota archaeon]|nr:MAG: tetratricopeptide repeat protein [Euryarchaeota archaeon]
MDESYLEWLSSIPGSDLGRARRIAERFPTYEALRSATREQLASVEGLTPQDIESILGLLGRAGEESNHLFLCPKCGSFVGTEAGACPFCGVEFDASPEDDLSEGLDQFLKEADQPPRICQTCGAAMTKDATTCGICHRRYTAEELALLPGLDASLDDSAPFCPRCGAYLFSDESECAICGSPIAERPEVTPAGKSVVKDFLTRWQRMAEPVSPIAEADRLREELDHFDRLLEADASLERAWANRAKVLEKLGRPKEAVESLAKAAELNPARDEEYRLEVQNLLRTTGDASVLPPRWKQPAATSSPAPSAKLDPRLLDALAHYDSLLKADGSLVVAWQTKAEILERLGRTDEARASRDRAEQLARAEEGSLRSGATGLRSSGLGTPGLGTVGYTNGRTNGRVNGRTNGHVNGRTNGRVNGVSEGRVNGLTFGRGATNGLVNGNGFTNGRRSGPAAPRIPAQPHWSRSVTGIAAVVALMLIVPILASILSPSPAGPSALIRIDGDFSDWAAIPAYADSPIDQIQNPAVNLLATKVATQGHDLFVNARVQGLLFDGASPNETDSVFVFVDQDANRLTGYPIGDLGADSAVEVFGWSQLGSIEHGVLALEFDASRGPRSNDWSRFIPGGSADAAFSNQDLELRMTVADPANARILTYAADNLGNRDPADGSVRASLPTLIVEQATVAPDVVTGRTAILRVTLDPLGGIPHATALNVTRLGSSTDPVDLSVYRDDGSGNFDPADALLSTVPMTGTTASLPVDRDISSPTILWVEASWTNMTATSTFGLSVDGLASNGTASFRSPEIGLVYLASAPTSLQIDGAFGDWQGRTYGQDFLGDVTNRTGALEYNANVDILATAVDVGTNFTGYVRVDGRILGGQDIPTSRSRTYVSAADTDLDTVPDWVETTLRSGLERDFNNDNTTDDQTGHDVDGDGQVDHPDGTGDRGVVRRVRAALRVRLCHRRHRTEWGRQLERPLCVRPRSSGAMELRPGRPLRVGRPSPRIRDQRHDPGSPIRLRGRVRCIGLAPRVRCGVAGCGRSPLRRRGPSGD